MDYPKKCRACKEPAYESFMGVWSCTNEDCSNFCTRLKEKIAKNPSLSKLASFNKKVDDAAKGFVISPMISLQFNNKPITPPPTVQGISIHGNTISGANGSNTP